SSWHSTWHASNSESLVANSSLGDAAAGAPSRSTISPPECVSTAGRIFVHRAVSIQTRPFFTGNIVADGSLTNFGIRGARDFHLAPFASATSFAKRAAIMAGVSLLR